MTLEEKKEQGVLFKTLHVTKKSLHIYTKKRRMFSLVVFFLTAIYTVANKFLFTPQGVRFIDFDHLFVLENLMLLATLVNLVVLLIISFFGNSIYALNHYVMFRRLKFISSLCKVVIFISAITVATASLNAITQDVFHLNLGTYLFGRATGQIKESIINHTGTIDYSIIFKYISLLIAIITIIPVIFFFLKNYAKLFLYVIMCFSAAIIALPLVIYLLSRRFDEYVPDWQDEKYVYKNMYSLPTKGWHIFLIIFCEIAFIGIMILIIISIINNGATH